MIVPGHLSVIPVVFLRLRVGPAPGLRRALVLHGVENHGLGIVEIVLLFIPLLFLAAEYFDDTPRLSAVLFLYFFQRRPKKLVVVRR